MNQTYIPATFGVAAFNCPHCGAYAKQNWSYISKLNSLHNNNGGSSVNIYPYMYIKGGRIAECSHCNQHTFWLNDKMIYPYNGLAQLPNPDMPNDVRSDYEEARSIVSISPRGAVALLRLAIQKLCKHLGESGDNINTDISNLVKKGLPVKLQRALDSVRVVGNNAVHPGQIDLKDDVETATKLFAFINIICDSQISQQKQIDAFYQEVIPDNLKQAIEQRDAQ
jgi:hypothetical protein